MTTATHTGEQPPTLLSLGPWLKQRRRILDMTQDELAHKSVCSLATIRKIEAGDLLPSKQLALQIAIALGIAEGDQAAFVAFARAERAAVMATAFTAPSSTSDSFAQPASAPVTRRWRVPAQLTPLVGREWEVQATCTLLRRPVARLLTLTGPPGSGKTRLALAIGEALQQEFASGALFVPLAPIVDASLVATSIAQALGLRVTSGNSLEESLIDHLRDQQLLLILDNFEQVIAAAPLLSELLMASARLKLLVTSRTILHLYGEHEFPVPPLPLPDANEIVAADELLLYPAIELFVQRAQAVQPAFVVNKENAKAVIQICTWIEGLPLAIEMAAAQVKWHSPQALVGLLSGRLASLSNGPRYLAPRQQTLRGAIEWSYNLLSGDERRLFTNLAVFVSGFTMDAVVALPNASGPATQNQVAHWLQSLVDHSLLKLQPDAGGVSRYEMLETLREYAVEQLTSQGDLAAVQRSHALYYLNLAQHAVSQLAGEKQEFWLDQLATDYENLRAALAWSLTNDVAIGLQLATELGEYWYMQGNLNEGRGFLSALLAKAIEATPRPVLANALRMAGYLAFRQGDHLESEPFLQESLAQFHALNDQAAIAKTLHNLGVVAFHQNNYARAHDLYQQALALYQHLGLPSDSAVVLKDLGLVAKDRGELDQAMRYFEESLHLHQASGNKHGIARCLTSMSVVAYWQGNYALAGDLGWQSLAIQRELGDKLGVAYTLENLGMALYKQGIFATAAAQMEECLALFRATGDKMGVVLALDNLGIFALAGGNAVDAVHFHSESLALAWQIREKRRMAFSLEGLAAAAGQSERAVQLFAGAATLRLSIDAPLLPADRDDYAEKLSKLQTHLGSQRYEEAWRRGQERSLEEAISYALNTDAG